MTDEHRSGISAKIAELEVFARVSQPREHRESTLGLIGKMLLAYPMAGSSAEAGKARGEAYLDALDDVPAWAINEAIRRWHRGEGGGQGCNYRFAPAPAELRFAAMQILQPAKQTISHLSSLLTAPSIERAMDPTPIDVPTSNQPRLRLMR